MITSPLVDIVLAQKRGEAQGIVSICSAHPYVIEASFRHALATRSPVLIESTCNQVNQYGGYTGMTPSVFRDYVGPIADSCGYPQQRILFGGDHLGPSPWQDEPAASAMEKARTLVRDYVAAGFQKIHLDASMKCGDDDPDLVLEKHVSAGRAAELAAVAEQACAKAGGIPPLYVIGTEVPLPGGAQEHEDALTVTTPTDVAETIAVTRQAFVGMGLGDAWTRVIAVVVQPGVEYGDSSLFEYDPATAQSLSSYIEQDEQLVYEAHSTDYQTAQALRNLVTDHFAILKVGPALTFAFREAIFALALVEEDLLGGKPDIELSHIREVLEQAMLENPVHWRNYYQGNDVHLRFARRFSFSDRSRYYWPVSTVQMALSRLLDNLGQQPIPLILLSQYLPVQYQQLRRRCIANTAHDMILSNISSVLDEYAYACGTP